MNSLVYYSDTEGEVEDKVDVGALVEYSETDEDEDTVDLGDEDEGGDEGGDLVEYSETDEDEDEDTVDMMDEDEGGDEDEDEDEDESGDEDAVDKPISAPNNIKLNVADDKYNNKKLFVILCDDSIKGCCRDRDELRKCVEDLTHRLLCKQSTDGYFCHIELVNNGKQVNIIGSKRQTLLWRNQILHSITFTKTKLLTTK